MDAIKDWFKGFEKGITRLAQEQRESFFQECGKNCVKGEVFDIYKQLYEKAGGDLDLFFQKINDLPGVKGEIIQKGREYNLCFSQCVCHLHTAGYVNTPLLCECSRQSVLYTMHALWQDKSFVIEVRGTILRGDKECKLNIKVLPKL